MIKFTRQGVRADGEPLYRLEKDGEVLREGITLDDVIYAINRMDEERTGLHGGAMRARDREVTDGGV